MKRILGLIFLLTLALPALARAQTTTHALSNTPTCTATSGSHPSLDIYYGTLAANGTPALPGTSAGCIQGDEIEFNPTQATNGSFTYTVSTANGTVNLGGAPAASMPVSTGGSTNTQLLLLYKYNAVASTPEWDLVPQVTLPMPATLSAVVYLTATQINHLFSAPQTVLAAPGVGKAIIPLFVEWFVNAGTIPLGSQNGSSGTVLLTASGPTGLILNGDAGTFQSFVSSFVYVPALPSTGFAPAGHATYSLVPIPLISSVISNQPLVLSNNTADYVIYGAILTSGITSGNAGTLYVVNDTGTIHDGNGDAGGTPATYIITSVDAGGAVTGFTVTDQGNAGYTTSTGNATATGGAQPGVGTGFQIDVNSVTPGNGTGGVVIFYQIVTLP